VNFFCAAFVGIGVVLTLLWLGMLLGCTKKKRWFGRVRKFKAQVLMGQIPLFAIKAHPQRLLESLGIG